MILLSEVIEEFIRRHPGMAERDAFEAFLREPRIASWVGADASRRERLQREFDRVWSRLQDEPAAPAAPSAPAAPPAPAAPAQAKRPAPIVHHEAPEPPRSARVDVRTHRAHGAARRLNLLCPACTRVDVWLADGAITCRSCQTTYEDMLALVPVKPVGPFAYVFGEGVKGYLTAGGVALLLLVVYGVLKWV